jgi:2-aminoadipate transaminase
MSASPATAAAVPVAGWARALDTMALRELLELTARPGVLSLALGLPDPALFPADALARAAERVLTTDPGSLQLQVPRPPLKRQVVALMAERGVACREEQVLLTAGAQQGLSLLTRLLCEPGSPVLLEEISYTGLHQMLRPFPAEPVTVPTGLAGMDVEAVAAALGRGVRPAFIYAMPVAHNPLGVEMPAAACARLVELARRHEVPIVEDDPYGFLWYGDAPPRPLRALDPDWVLYLGTFSKILAPALRVGWAVVPEALLGKLALVKDMTDIDCATFTQRVVSELIASGDLAPHVPLLRREYGARRDAMLAALAEHFPEGTRWTLPGAGMFVWVELPRAVDTTALLRQAVEKERVAFVPGAAFSLDGRTGRHALRLNFSNPGVAEIREGVARLGRVVKAVLAG